MLTHVRITATKPAQKPLKLFDGGGMYLLVQPNGARWWRLKYRFHGRERLISLGVYPDVSLASARQKRDDARRLLAAGIDPGEQRRIERHSANDTFELIAREWHELAKAKWTEQHGIDVLSRLESNIFPTIGGKPIRDVTAPDLLRALRRIESRGANETARRTRQICGCVFRYAIATGRADRDPSADLRGALAPVETKHHAAVTDPKQAAGLLRALDAYNGTLIVQCALRFAPLVFVRPGELRHAEWTEIDFDRAEWTIPAWRMKMRQTLTVPLSRQALAILRELHPVTGDGRFVFPSPRAQARPLSENAVLAALRRSGITTDEMTGHGFRAMARTILDEVLGIRVDLIEHQLGHAVKDPNGRAYNRTSFLPERRDMMQRWADFLDNLKSGTTAVSSEGGRFDGTVLAIVGGTPRLDS